MRCIRRPISMMRSMSSVCMGNSAVSYGQLACSSTSLCESAFSLNQRPGAGFFQCSSTRFWALSRNSRSFSSRSMSFWTPIRRARCAPIIEVIVTDPRSRPLFFSATSISERI